MISGRAAVGQVAGDILRGPQRREVVYDDGRATLVVEPLRFVPVVMIHRDRASRAVAVAGRGA